MANLVEQEVAQVFGHYQVLGVLGEGSMGKLYLAEHRNVDGGAATVALRSFGRQLAGSAHFQETLRDSVRVAIGLRHPNIAATHELGELDGRQFLTMEYLPGESLLSILSKCTAPTPMPPTIAAALVHQCAEALRYAHEVRNVPGTQPRVVHRDIRPANIFVTYQGMVKVVGLGAGPLRADIIELRGAPRDAFAYMAPDVMEGDVPDVRSDIFSMGVVLWECLTGRPLFHAETPAKETDAVRGRYIEPASVFNPDMPPGLDEVALRALSRDPRRRYQSAKEMSLAIDTAIMGHGRRPTSAAIAEWMERLFGAERASLKTQIARGSGVPAALARLRLLGGDGPAASARPLEHSNLGLSHGSVHWSPGVTSGTQAKPEPLSLDSRTPLMTEAPPPFSPSPPRTEVPADSPLIPPASAQPAAAISRTTTSSPPGPVSRSPRTAARPGVGIRGLVAIGAGIAVAIVVAVVVFRGAGPGPSPSSKAVVSQVGFLQIVSTPPGAQILVDGDPSGLATPARIDGLSSGRKFEIRVDKPGYKSEKQTTDVPSTGSRTLTFILVESVGTVRLDGVPPHATTYVDDATVNGNQPLSLPVGFHRLRVEVSGRLFTAMKLDVRPGAQRVSIREGNSQ